MSEQLTFQNHPLKAEICQRWENNQSNKSINEWLKANYPNVVLSIMTLCKHEKRYRFNKNRVESAEKEENKPKSKRKHVPVEEILWETIRQCRRMKKDKSISVKDWQYLDQQMQCAVEKIIRIKDTSGDTRDFSTMMAEIFSKLETEGEVDINDVDNAEVGEEEKLKIIEEVDSESKANEEENSETT